MGKCHAGVTDSPNSKISRSRGRDTYTLYHVPRGDTEQHPSPDLPRHLSGWRQPHDRDRGFDHRKAERIIDWFISNHESEKLARFPVDRTRRPLMAIDPDTGERRRPRPGDPAYMFLTGRPIRAVNLWLTAHHLPPRPSMVLLTLASMCRDDGYVGPFDPAEIARQTGLQPAIAKRTVEWLIGAGALDIEPQRTEPPDLWLSEQLLNAEPAPWPAAGPGGRGAA